MFELDDERKVQKKFFFIVRHGLKTFQVEDIYLLLTKFEARTVSYRLSYWPIYGPSAKKVIAGLFWDTPLRKLI